MLFMKANARVIAVSVNTQEENRDVVERLGLPFPIVADADLTLTKALGVVHEGGGMRGEDIPRPAVFIVDKGTIRWSTLTDNWRIRVSGEAILAALSDLSK